MKMYIEYERVEGKPNKRLIEASGIVEVLDKYNELKDSLIKQNEENTKNNYANGLVIYCQLLSENNEVILYNNILNI